MRAPDDERLSKALAVLELLPADRERWAKNIKIALTLLANNDNELEFERDSAGLTRYIKALRELQVSHAALGLSIQRFLPPLEGVSDTISEAQIMQEMCRRSRGHPANKRTRSAVDGARILLEMCGLELTTERNGKWHLLSQIFADANRDLRHHLTASLAQK